MWEAILQQIIKGNAKALARCLTLIENGAEGYQKFLQSLPTSNPSIIIGITGPPGAGKSTLADALVGSLINDQVKIAVLCVDPTSPFNMGALLGDRIRLSQWYNHPNVFIRSFATRGSLGGLHPKIIEATDVVKAANFNYIIIETVGVGQSEVEIAGLADTTVVVLVPEGGDVIQTMKAGLMEIADIFVVNKSDRAEADSFANNLKQMLSTANFRKPIPVINTIASQKEGVKKLKNEILRLANEISSDKKLQLATEKAYQIIRQNRMNDVSKPELRKQIEMHINDAAFNIYTFAQTYL